MFFSNNYDDKHDEYVDHGETEEDIDRKGVREAGEERNEGRRRGEPRNRPLTFQIVKFGERHAQAGRLRLMKTGTGFMEHSVWCGYSGDC